MTLIKSLFATALLTISLGGLTNTAIAQDASINSKPVSAQRLLAGESIDLDGSLDHPAWQRAAVHDSFIEREPNYGKTPTHRTTLRILYDDKAIFAGVEALDPAPRDIISNQVRHDRVLRSQDFVALYIDAQGDRKAAQFFRVNPQGYIGDGLHTAVDDNEDFLPDFEFSAAARINSAGYTAVFRIPFSSLRYDPKGTKPWTLMLVRRLPRAQNTLLMSVDLPRDAAHFLRQMQVIENLTPPISNTSISIRPTLTGRLTEERSPIISREKQLKPSIDVKWQPRNEWVIDGTINPDFSQLELDEIEPSRNNKFALFKQEKRPVFLESRDLITLQNNAIYTRAITDPRWAFRSTWRDQSLSGSVIATQDKGKGLTVLPGPYSNSYANQPANQTFIARGIYKDYGTVLAHRRYEQGRGSNSIFGIDRSIDISSKWRGRLQTLMSYTDALPGDNGELQKDKAKTGALLSSSAQYSTNDIVGGVDGNWISKYFRNDVGLTTQNREYDVAGWMGKKFRPEGALFSLIEPGLSGYIVKDLENKKTIRSDFAPYVYMETDSGIESKIEIRTLNTVRGSEAGPLMREKYIFQYAFIPINAVVQNINFNSDIGRLADYSVEQVRPAFRFAISAKLRPFAFKGSGIADRIEIEPNFNVFRFRAQGNTVSSESSSRLLALLHLAPGQSIRFISQTSRYQRFDELKLATGEKVSADNSRSQTQSLTYIWRQSANDALYIGASRSVSKAQFADKTESREWFVKWQKQL